MTGERRTALRGGCGVLLSASLLLAAGCRSGAEAPNGDPVVLRLGVPEATVSAAGVGLPQAARYFNVEGLTTRSDDGRPLPRLATSWAPSADGLTWRLTLRNDVTFHDGSKLTAALVRDSLARSLAQPGTRVLYPGLTDVTEIRAASDTELVIALNRRSAFLLEDLEFPITRRLDGGREIGTGPFKTAREDSNEILLEPHRGYYNGEPRIDRIHLKPYPALRTAWAGLMRQEIDALWDIAHESTEFVESSDLKFYSYLRPYVFLVAVNSSRPPFSRAPVRRALNAAIDRESLIRDVLKGHGQAATGPVWPRHWAYDGTLPRYSHDASLAAATLDLAGLPPRRVEGKVPARFSFVCLVPRNYAVLERLALNVQKQLYDVGVDMQLESVSADEYNRRIPKGDFDAIMIEMISGPVLARAYQFWRSAKGYSGMNVFGYENPAADRWFDAIRYSAGETEYRAAVGQLQRVLLEDPPAIFLAWNERSRVISRRFVVPVEPGRDPLPSVAHWVPAANAPQTRP